jgi:GNAT superfamily N-acetyltransferase
MHGSACGRLGFGLLRRSNLAWQGCVVPVRRAVQRDWESSRAIRLEALREAPMAFASTYEREIALLEQHWRDRIARSAQFLATDEAGAVVGTVTGFVDAGDPGTTHLVAMYVSGRARSRGVGEQLVEAVIAEAKRAGARRVRLHVVETNPNAERLYARCGFVRTGATMALPHQPDLLEHEMELLLG